MYFKEPTNKECKKVNAILRTEENAGALIVAFRLVQNDVVENYDLVVLYIAQLMVKACRESNNFTCEKK